MVDLGMSINNHARVVLAALPACAFDSRDAAIAEQFPEVFTTRTSRMACSQAELDYLTGEGEEKAEE